MCRCLLAHSQHKAGCQQKLLAAPSESTDWQAEVQRLAVDATESACAQIQASMQAMREDLDARFRAHESSVEARMTQTKTDLVTLCDEVKQWCESLDQNTEKNRIKDNALQAAEVAVEGLSNMENLLDSLSTSLQKHIDELSCEVQAPSLGRTVSKILVLIFHRPD